MEYPPTWAKLIEQRGPIRGLKILPLVEIQAKTKEELIAKIIEHEMSKGKSKEQLAAMAEAKRRGMDVCHERELCRDCPTNDQ